MLARLSGGPGHLFCPLLPVEMRSYSFVFKDVSHETPDTMTHRFVVRIPRETPEITPCHTSPPQGVGGSVAGRGQAARVAGLRAFVVKWVCVD